CRIKAHGTDWRRSKSGDLFEQAPSFRSRQRRLPDQVRRYGVARKLRLIDDQHSIALAREQHRQRRPRASCANNDHVLHMSPFRILDILTGKAVSWKNRHLPAAAVLCALVILAFSSSFQAVFAWDNQYLILNDPRIRA